MPRVSFHCAQQVRRSVQNVALVVCGAAFIAGCTPLQKALWDSSTSSWKKETATVALQPPQVSLQQMHVIVQQTPFWMSLVHSEDASQKTAQKSDPLATQVWMTPAGEIIRLTAQGRLSSTFGTAYADWTRVEHVYPPHNWQQVRKHLLQGKSVQYQRVRDVALGGYANIQERITIAHLEKAPKINWPYPLPLAEQLHWFEERTQLLDPAGRWSLLPPSDADTAPMGQALPPARFAVALWPDGREQVVYSEQCLSHAVCLRMQHWFAPAAPQNP